MSAKVLRGRTLLRSRGLLENRRGAAVRIGGPELRLRGTI
jgi:hypothetical protein